MFFKLFLIFAVIPLIELGILIKIGTHIGTLNTISLVILTAAVGAYMVYGQTGRNRGTFPHSAEYAGRPVSGRRDD
jgi:UPF0716 protein FxsA